MLKRLNEMKLAGLSSKLGRKRSVYVEGDNILVTKIRA